MWQIHYAGDTAKVAETMSGIKAALPAIGFFLHPALAALCDSSGRRPVLLFAYIVSFAQKLVLLNGTGPNAFQILSFCEVVKVCYLAPVKISNLSSLADLNPDPEALASAQSIYNMAPAAVSIVGPLLAGYLGGMDLLLPVRVAANSKTQTNKSEQVGVNSAKGAAGT